MLFRKPSIGCPFTLYGAGAFRMNSRWELWMLQGQAETLGCLRHPKGVVLSRELTMEFLQRRALSMVVKMGQRVEIEFELAIDRL